MNLKNVAACLTAGMLAVAATPGLAAAETPKTPDACARVYHEETVIAASPATIFGVILELSKYGEWNPWLISAEGDMVEGGSVTVQVVLNGQSQKADHTV